jgi:hypothetical protein
MKFKALSIVAAIIACVHSAAAEPAQQPKIGAPDAMASANYLIGTWSCAHTVGTFSGRYTTTYSKVLGDRWLKETWDFPSSAEQPAVEAEALMGYDEARQTWVRFFANSLGQHFEIRMTEVPDGWAFKYTTFYPRTRPDTPDPDATFTKISDSEYRIEGPTYPQGETRVTEHHICRKV